MGKIYSCNQQNFEDFMYQKKIEYGPQSKLVLSNQKELK